MELEEGYVFQIQYYLYTINCTLLLICVNLLGLWTWHAYIVPFLV